ncbi:unnamed protein product [marine sediment metagenome]|uniref:Uncharacterized protein n=1 Tax=marine sediment metagenome TaxID=412755 RepID=X1PVV7_9ZZZZ
MTKKPRQRTLNEYYSSSIRVIEVFKHGQFVPVKEEEQLKALRKNIKVNMSTG